MQMQEILDGVALSVLLIIVGVVMKMKSFADFNAEPPSKFIMCTPSVEIWRAIVDEPRVQWRCDYGGGKREQIAKKGGLHVQ